MTYHYRPRPPIVHFTPKTSRVVAESHPKGGGR